MNTKQRVYRNRESDLSITSRSMNSGSTARTTKYKTLKEAPKREYPKSYKQYKKSAAKLGRNEIITARSFAAPQRVVNFNANARNITGGIVGFMEGTLTVRSAGFFKKLNSQKNYVKVENAKLSIFEAEPEDDLVEDDDVLLEIPFVEMRAIVYPKDGAKEFKLVFNSQSETERGVIYRPHTLMFAAPTSEIIEDWIKAILVGCINTSLFLETLISYFQDHPKYADDKKKEIFLRQIVDLSTLGRGLLNQATVNAQETLSRWLLEKGDQEEGEFWHKIAFENNLRIKNEEKRPIVGLAGLQDFVDDSIRAGKIDLNADYETERRTSFMLPRRFSTRKYNTTKPKRASDTSKSSDGFLSELQVPPNTRRERGTGYSKSSHSSDNM